PQTVFSSIDHSGRYAYGNQPRIAQWHLARFAETLLPLIDEDPQNAAALATQVVEAFSGRFELAIETGWCHKIGLPEATQEDVALALDLLKIMIEQQADFTLTFRALGDELIAGGGAEVGMKGEAEAELGAGAARARDLFAEPTAFDAWAARWRTRLSALGADVVEIGRASCRERVSIQGVAVSLKKQAEITH